MNDLVPLISSFVPGLRLNRISKGWHQSITHSDRDILDALYIRYPSDSVQDSIIQAIEARDIPTLQALTNTYQGFLPVRWDVIAMHAPTFRTLRTIEGRISPETFELVYDYKLASRRLVINRLKWLVRIHDHDKIRKIMHFLADIGRYNLINKILNETNIRVNLYITSKLPGYQYRPVLPLPSDRDRRLVYYTIIPMTDDIAQYHQYKDEILSDIGRYVDHMHGRILKDVLENDLDDIQGVPMEYKIDISKEIGDAIEFYRRYNDPNSISILLSMALKAGYVELLDKYGDIADWDTVVQYISDRSELPLLSRRFLATIE